MKIAIGDYIRSDFASFVQGTVVGFGIMGKRILCYRIKDPIGKEHLIIKGQAELLLTPEEAKQGRQIVARHD